MMDEPELAVGFYVDPYVELWSNDLTELGGGAFPGSYSLQSSF